MNNVQMWFQREITSRTIVAIIKTWILQLPLILALSLVLPLHAIPSLTFSISGCLRFLFLCGTVMAVAFVHRSFFSVAPQVHVSRWKMLTSFVSPKFLFLLLSYGTLSSFAVASYVQLCDPGSGVWRKPCSDRNGDCFNDTYASIVLFGFLLGLTLAYDYYWKEGRYLSFPIVDLPLRAAVRSQLFPMAKAVFRSTLRNYVIFLGLKFAFGRMFQSQMASVLRVPEDPASLNSFRALLDVTLALKAVIVGSAWVFTFRVLLNYFQLCQSRHILFPVQRYPGEATTAPLLGEALSATREALLHLWACRDFCTLAEQSINRRAEIFRISQPGNHAHNWESLTSSIVPVLESFLSAFRGNAGESPSKVEETTAKPSSPPQQPRLRRLATPLERSVILQDKEKVSLSANILKTIQEVKGHIARKPIVRYLFGEFPDAHKRQLFASSQPIIWLVEGLSHVIAASFKEDSDGVVQRDLAKIMTLLMELDSVLDSRSKGAEGYRKLLASPPRDVTLKRALRWTVKSSLYRVTQQFGKHILDVNMSLEHRLALQQYLDFSKK